MRCANACVDEEDCRRIDCCHNCLLYLRGECVNDGSQAFAPRYFLRLAQA